AHTPGSYSGHRDTHQQTQAQLEKTSHGVAHEVGRPACCRCSFKIRLTSSTAKGWAWAVWLAGTISSDSAPSRWELLYGTTPSDPCSPSPTPRSPMIEWKGTSLSTAIPANAWIIGFCGDRPLMLVGSSFRYSLTSGAIAVPACSSTRRTGASTVAGTAINIRPILPAALSARLLPRCGTATKMIRLIKGVR